MEESTTPRLLSRRSLLLGAGMATLVACSTSSENAEADVADTPDELTPSSTTASEPVETESAESTESTESTPAATGELEALSAAMFSALPLCTLLPSSTAGPFPTLEQLERRDVTEGYPGHPLRLGIRVVDASCEPLPGAEVEIWHTDATGDYSSYSDNGSGKDEGAGTTFCRGFQTADADGILEFQTIYPGWYEGRAIHIHVRARVAGQEVLTAQLYFDEAYSESVLATGEYAQFGPPGTGWSDDFLIGDPTVDGTGIVLTPGPTSLGDGTLGLVNLSVAV